MSETIKDVVEQELKEAFYLFDHTGEGIESHDFGTVIRVLGHDLSEKVANSLGESLGGESGLIKFDQFRTFFYSRLQAKQTKDSFKQAFRAIDADRDGLISFNDLRAFLGVAGQSHSEEDITEMLRHADVDGDDHISYEEFARLMSTH